MSYNIFVAAQRRTLKTSQFPSRSPHHHPITLRIVERSCLVRLPKAPPASLQALLTPVDRRPECRILHAALGTTCDLVNIRVTASLNESSRRHSIPRSPDRTAVGKTHTPRPNRAPARRADEQRGASFLLFQDTRETKDRRCCPGTRNLPPRAAPLRPRDAAEICGWHRASTRGQFRHRVPVIHYETIVMSPTVTGLTAIGSKGRNSAVTADCCKKRIEQGSITMREPGKKTLHFRNEIFLVETEQLRLLEMKEICLACPWSLLQVV